MTEARLEPAFAAPGLPRLAGGLVRGNALPVGFVALALGVLAVLPLARLLLMAVAPAGALDFALMARTLVRPATLRALGNTLDSAVFGALLAGLIGIPAALLVAMTDLPGRRLFGFLLLLPLMVAPQITALSWSHLLGPSSTLLTLLHLAPPPGSNNPLLGRGGVILLFGLQEAPIVFITMRAGLAGIPRDFVEAARGAGSSPWSVLADIVLPVARPYAVAALALAFVGCVGNFGIPALLGMSAGYLTLSTLIYQQLTGLGPDVLPQMACLSALVGLITVFGIAVQGAAFGRRPAAFANGRPARFALSRWRWPAAALVGLLLFAALLLPILSLIGTSLIPAYGVPLTPATLTFDNYAEVLLRQAATARAFLNSATLSAAAALLLAFGAVPLAVAAGKLPGRGQRLAAGIADLSYALPGVALAIACILLFLRPLPLIGSLYATAWIILVAYLMRFLPLALKPVQTATARIPHDLLEAAAASGAGPLRRLVTITTPLAAPAAVAGALLVFMSAFGELTVSALLWSGGHETVGVILFSLDGAGLVTQASAIAVITIAVVVALLLVADGLGRKLPPGVLPWR